MTDDTPSRWDAQHVEIDEAQSDLDDMQRELNRILDLRRSKTPNGSETYLRGLYDGLYYAEERVERITQYTAPILPADVDNEALRRKLSTILSEAANDNWGNVRVNLEAALEQAEELAEDTDGESTEA